MLASHLGVGEEGLSDMMGKHPSHTCSLNILGPVPLFTHDPLLVSVIPLSPGSLVLSSVDLPPPERLPSPTTGLLQLPVQLLWSGIFCVSFPLTPKEHESPGTE